MKKYVALTIKGHNSNCLKNCEAEIEVVDRKFANVYQFCKDVLLTDVVLGQKFMQQHEGINIRVGGDKSVLELGALKPLKTISSACLFEHFAADCHPVTTKTRRCSKSDNDFTRLKDGVY